MKKILTLCLVLSFVLLQAQPEPWPMVSHPEKAGLSSQHLARLDTLVLSAIRDNVIPGGVFLIARKGQLVYHKAFGDRSRQQQVPAEKSDLFRIASMTKAITSVAIMQLYEQGQLLLDDPVSRYLPAFAQTEVLDQFNEADSTYTTVPPERPITIRHLLTHTSGITYGPFNPGKLEIIYGQHGMNAAGLSHPDWSTEEFIDRLAAVPLAFQPGDRYLYGLNMDVLGRIIEVVAGMPLDEYFQQYIFKPAGMVDTYFYLPADKADRLTPVYSPTDDQGLQEFAVDDADLPFNYPVSVPRDHFAGGGGLSSTAIDYAQFIQALLLDEQDGRHRLLSRNAIETMTSDQLIVQNEHGKGISKTPGITFCLGFRLYTEAAAGHSMKSPGTYEWGGYFNTKYFIDPDEDLIFVGMTQVVPFPQGNWWQKVYSVIYGSIRD